MKMEENNKWKEEVAEDWCFFCKDGGIMRICDYDDCLKAFHAKCEGQEESFLERDDYWCCGTHYCFICRKSSTYQCYCCPKAYCRSCVVEESDEFAIVKGKKGFCSHCLELSMMIEQKTDVTSGGIKIDFTAPGTYEYLYSEYYRRIKEKEGIDFNDVHSAHILLKNKAIESGEAKTPRSAGSSKKGKETATPTTSLHKRKRSCSTTRRVQSKSSTSTPISTPTLTPLHSDYDLNVDLLHAGASIADETVENASSDVTYPLVPANFASLTSEDDGKLASSFVSIHPDIVFPDPSYPKCFLEPGYKTFVFVLKMFRDSSSIHELLVSENRAVLVDKLKGMKLFGFSGSWLETLLDKLDGPNSRNVQVNISVLNQSEESYDTERVCLVAHIDELSAALQNSYNKLNEVEEKLKDIAQEKKVYAQACDELGPFLNF